MGDVNADVRDEQQTPLVFTAEPTDPLPTDFVTAPAAAPGYYTYLISLAQILTGFGIPQITFGIHSVSY